jgi:rhomboid family GlyGly-CTERM serine protease
MKRKLPIITLGLTVPALIIWIIPSLQSWFVYDRTAILNGEIWRLLTGNWVHFSLQHLLYDVAAFGIAGALAEKERFPGFGRFCSVAPIAIGFAVLLLNPEIGICGGLSGMATGAIVFVALNGAVGDGVRSRICRIALIMVAGKMLMELGTGRMLFLSFNDPSMVSVPTSHFIGALVAGFIALRFRAIACRNLSSAGLRPADR